MSEGRAGNVDQGESNDAFSDFSKLRILPRTVVAIVGVCLATAVVSGRAGADTELYENNLSATISGMQTVFGDEEFCSALQADAEAGQKYKRVKPIESGDVYDPNRYQKYNKSCPDMDLTLGGYSQRDRQAHRDFRLYEISIAGLDQPLLVFFARDYMYANDWERYKTATELERNLPRHVSIDSYAVVDRKKCVTNWIEGARVPGRRGILEDHSSIYKGNGNFIFDYTLSDKGEKAIFVYEIAADRFVTALAKPVCTFSSQK
jgi:hypothetical protein